MTLDEIREWYEANKTHTMYHMTPNEIREWLNELDGREP